MEQEKLLNLIPPASTDSHFVRPLQLTELKENAYRLSSATGPYFLKWIPNQENIFHDELNEEHLKILSASVYAPTLLFPQGFEGGTLAIWEWLSGEDLRKENRHLLPAAFASLGDFHQGCRHDLPVLAADRQAFRTVDELVSAEQARLTPLIEESDQYAFRACLNRLRQGYATYIHGDMHPGNIFKTRRGFQFVDWSLMVPSLNFFDLDYIESVKLDLPMQFWAYMDPKEAEPILESYASHCGLDDIDILGIHIAVMLWRDANDLEHCLEHPQKQDRVSGYRKRITQMLSIESARG